MRIPEHHVFLSPRWTSFLSCICISICDFKASSSCSSSEVEGNISSNRRQAVFPSTGALQEHIPGDVLLGCRARTRPQARQRDQDRVGKWHCQDTRTAEEEGKAAQEGARTGTCLQARSIMEPMPFSRGAEGQRGCFQQVQNTHWLQKKLKGQQIKIFFPPPNYPCWTSQQVFTLFFQRTITLSLSVDVTAAFLYILMSSFWPPLVNTP